jgi:hypothetical protein
LAAIDRKERAFDWGAWFGAVDSAKYLTGHGRSIARRAAADLEGFFGPSWLPTATDPASGHWIARLGAESPLLAINEAGAVAAYVETLRWWSSLRVLEERSTVGLQSVLKQLRTDITAQRFRHSLAQARLAAQGLARGIDVVLEPSKAGGGLGDVLLRTGRSEVFIEIVSSVPVPNHDEEAYDDHVVLLWRQSPDLSWEGEVPGLLDRAREQAWRAAVAEAAAHCLETRAQTSLSGDWPALTVRHRGASADGTLSGPDVSIDQSRRLAGVIDRKAAQTRGASMAWIWIEDHGGLHQLTPFSSMPIQDKVDAFSGLTGPLLAGRNHIAGIVWSRAVRSDSLRSGEVESPRGLAIERPLAGGQVRQSVVVHRDLVIPDQLDVLARILDREPQWLDWALHELRAGSIAQCLSGYEIDLGTPR